MEIWDLRYGNLIKHTNRNGTFILPVIGIFETHVQVKYKDGIWAIKYEEIEPIELTEEWLLKGGFIQNSNATREYNYISNNINFLIVNHYESGFLFKPDWWKGGKMIKHIHHLQNLYRYSTGNELNFKL